MTSALFPENSGATVLVADDDDAVRELLSQFLRGQGYRVVHARDGNEALKTLMGQPVDLALLDVMMPARSGFAVCRALKDNPKTRLLPVVLITGLEAREDRIQGIEAGADDFLSKPLNKQELMARVRSLLRLKQYTDELEHAETVISSLALSVEAKDPYTHGHCERLSSYSVALGKRLGLADEPLVALRRAGTVHDIGKVAIPDQILLKQEPLSDEEKMVMQMHPVVGERICAPLKSFRAVLPIIRHHHERFDGSGYPDGLCGEHIPQAARILQNG